MLDDEGYGYLARQHLLFDRPFATTTSSAMFFVWATLSSSIAASLPYLVTILTAESTVVLTSDHMLPLPRVLSDFDLMTVGVFTVALFVTSMISSVTPMRAAWT